MNKQGYSDFVEKNLDQLYVVANVILRNQADAEDAVCSSILKGYEKLDQLRDDKKIKSWLIAITKNEALQIYKRRFQLPGDDKVEQMLKPSMDSYDELWDVIERLPEEYRITIILFYYNNLPIKDIAEILDISVGTVKSRLHRGREILKEELKDL